MNDKNKNEFSIPERCDTIVGFKMTKSEKKKLEDYCHTNNVKMSQFCRYSVKKYMSDNDN